MERPAKTRQRARCNKEGKALARNKLHKRPRPTKNHAKRSAHETLFVKQAHSANINCLAFNPFNEFLLATGSSDTTVALWDMRNMAKPMHLLERHSSEAGDGEVCYESRAKFLFCVLCCASMGIYRASRGGNVWITAGWNV